MPDGLCRGPARRAASLPTATPKDMLNPISWRTAALMLPATCEDAAIHQVYKLSIGFLLFCNLNVQAAFQYSLHEPDFVNRGRLTIQCWLVHGWLEAVHFCLLLCENA